MQALEPAGLPRWEDAKPCKPAGNNTVHEMCDPARWGNRGDAHGAEKSNTYRVPEMAPRIRFTLGAKLFLLALAICLIGFGWALYELVA